MEAVAYELQFWKEFVKTERFLEDWCSNKKTGELHQEVYDFIQAIPDYRYKKAMDIGSGAVSILKGTLPGDNITTTDALACLYKIIFDYRERGIKPPLTFCGEELDKYFHEEFDIVHCSNAIDHTQEPIKVFQNMMHVCRKGGYVIVQGFENEAVCENWSGFHQWNFAMTAGGSVYYTDKNGNSKSFQGEVVFHKRKENVYKGKTWFICIWKK